MPYCLATLLVYMALACNFTSVGKHKFMHAHIAKYTQLSSKQKHIIIVIGVRWSRFFATVWFMREIWLPEHFRNDNYMIFFKIWWHFRVSRRLDVMPRLVKRFSLFEKYERYDSKGVSDLKTCLEFFVISERSYENLDYPAHFP